MEHLRLVGWRLGGSIGTTVLVVLAALATSCDATPEPPASFLATGPSSPGIGLGSPAPAPARGPRPTLLPGSSAAIATSTPAPVAAASVSPGPSGPPGAQAGPPADVGPKPCPGTGVSDRTGPGATDASTNWSGYAATSSPATISCVEASWIQPTIRCGSDVRQAVSIWVGIGGFDQTALEQIGSEVDCEGGIAIGSLWHESLPRERFEVQTRLTVRAGDRLRARVLARAGARYELTIANLTRSTSFTVRDTNARLDATSAEWIVEAPTGGCPSQCHLLPMPNFGRFRFSDTLFTVGGQRQPLVGASATHVRIAMEGAGGSVRARVTSTSSNGTSFVVSWVRR